MKKIPNRAKLPPPEPVVIKLDPKLLRGGIVLPKVKYEILATVETEEVFDGMVIPMPKVLIYFLSKNELRRLCQHHHEGPCKTDGSPLS